MLDIVTSMMFDSSSGYFPDDGPEAVFYMDYADTERGEERAEYGAGAACMLIEAGWDPAAPDRQGVTPLARVAAGKRHYAAQLARLARGQDPANAVDAQLEGANQVMRTVVGSRRAQAQAMVTACTRIEAAAAAAAAPGGP